MKHKHFYETSSTVAASKLYAIAVNVSTTSTATQTDLTFGFKEEEKKRTYLKTNQQSPHTCLWILEIHQKIYLETQVVVHL